MSTTTNNTSPGGEDAVSNEHQAAVRIAIELAASMGNQPLVQALTDVLSQLTAANGANGARELHEAARQFYNLTIGDSAVLIRAYSAEKRDAITAAGELLRALLEAGAKP